MSVIDVSSAAAALVYPSQLATYEHKRAAAQGKRHMSRGFVTTIRRRIALMRARDWSPI